MVGACSNVFAVDDAPMACLKYGVVNIRIAATTGNQINDLIGKTTGAYVNGRLSTPFCGQDAQATTAG